MQARSLKSTLTRQWTLFSAGVAVMFASAGLLLLFVLEDSFIDRQLKAAARSLSSSTPGLTRLPAEFSVYPASKAPLDIHARLPFAEVGKPFEMRRADRRYVHAILVDTPDDGPLVVVYDVTEQLTVTPRLGIGLLIVLALTAITLLAAALFARGFISRVTRQAGHLAEFVRESPNPESLRDLASRQQILEFQHLLGMHADIWKAQLSAVENERQTLAYLAHELRTPLQTAQTSLALLSERSDPAAFERLQRAVSRLTRASRAALWLATDREPDLSKTAPLLPVLDRITAELSPLAARKGQVIATSVSSSVEFHGPAEIAETILANLLLNAIQHSGAGSIAIRETGDALEMTNPCCGDEEPVGFGFGLEIVRRLGAQIGWVVDVKRSGNSMVTHIDMRQPTSPAR